MLLLLLSTTFACMLNFFFQSAFVDFDYGLQPLHYLHDFLHECILKYTNDMIHFGGALYCDPILV